MSCRDSDERTKRQGEGNLCKEGECVQKIKKNCVNSGMKTEDGTDVEKRKKITGNMRVNILRTQ